jgi:hypothetical protein
MEVNGKLHASAALLPGKDRHDSDPVNIYVINVWKN